MSVINRLVMLGMAAAVLSVSGCVVVPDHDRDHGPYRYDHGDRIDRDGHREARWCDDHHDDEHCH